MGVGIIKRKRKKNQKYTRKIPSCHRMFMRRQISGGRVKIRKKNVFISADKTYFRCDRSNWSAIACKKSSVFKYMPSLTFDKPWMHPARSLVIFPSSTTSMQACSKANANLANSGVLSNFARCSRPVHCETEVVRMLKIVVETKTKFKFTSSPCENRCNRIGGSRLTFLMLSERRKIQNKRPVCWQ